MSLSQALATAVYGLRVDADRHVDRRLQRGQRGDAGLCPQDGGPGRDRGRRFRRRRPRRLRSTATSTNTCSARCGSKARARATPTCASQFYDRLQSRLRRSRAPTARWRPSYNNFMTSLQALSTSAGFASARTAVLSSAQVLAQQLNGMTHRRPVAAQRCRTGHRRRRVSSANDAMQRIAEINQQLGAASSRQRTTATLLDQRDSLSRSARAADGHQRVPRPAINQVTVFTNSGIQLVGIAAGRRSTSTRKAP